MGITLMMLTLLYITGEMKGFLIFRFLLADTQKNAEDERRKRNHGRISNPYRLRITSSRYHSGMITPIFR
jgi:hypothetical protein